MADVDFLAIALRTVLYVAAFLVAGSAFFAATVTRDAPFARALRWQIGLAVIVLLAVEIARWVNFQLTISGGDVALAFSESLAWTAFETPVGQAMAVRVAAALGLAIFALSVPAIGVPLALVLIGSFAVEGHTAGLEGIVRWIAGGLIIVHLAIASWWFASFVPLRAATLAPIDGRLPRVTERFGRLATAAVPVLIAAGVALAVILSGGVLALDRPHQIALMVKLAAVAVILIIAAANKLRWTPMLSNEPERWRIGFRASLNREMLTAAAILTLSAVMISFAPSDD